MALAAILEITKVTDLHQICMVVQNRSLNSVNHEKFYYKKSRCQTTAILKTVNGIKGSMSKVAKSFICRGCLNPVTSAVRNNNNNNNDRLTAFDPGQPG